MNWESRYSANPRASNSSYRRVRFAQAPFWDKLQLFFLQGDAGVRPVSIRVRVHRPGAAHGPKCRDGSEASTLKHTLSAQGRMQTLPVLLGRRAGGPERSQLWVGHVQDRYKG